MAEKLKIAGLLFLFGMMLAAASYPLWHVFLPCRWLVQYESIRELPGRCVPGMTR